MFLSVYINYHKHSQWTYFESKNMGVHKLRWTQRSKDEIQVSSRSLSNERAVLTLCGK